MQKRKCNLFFQYCITFIICFGLANCGAGGGSSQAVNPDPAPTPALLTSLTVKEALPINVSGLARPSAPVTVGVPLPENSEIINTSQLGLGNAQAGQFRVLARWPNGNIKWVLVDFQTDINAGGTVNSISLTSGTGNFGGSNLATDSSTNIAIDTGIAQFNIKKSNFNIFNGVVVNGQSLVSAGNLGRLVATDSSGMAYSSANDGSSTATIEENGPVRSVVKCTGVLKSSSGTRYIDYTVRLHFYKGKSYVKGFITIRNARKAYNTHVTLLRGVEAIVPMSIGTKTITFSRNADTVSRVLGSGATGYLFQGYNNERAIDTFEHQCDIWDPPAPGTCSGSYYFTYDNAYAGLEVKSGAETINSLGSPSVWTKGYAGMQDSTGKGVTLAYRWMSTYWPSGFDFNDNGEASIGVISKHNTKNLKFIWGKHESREVMWNFHSTADNPAEVLYELQYPLVARAPYAYYATTKAIYGQSEFITVAEQDSFFAGLGKSSPSLANVPMSSLFRFWSWGIGGGGNQTDFPLLDFIDFLRTGNGGYYLRGEQRTYYNNDSAVHHSDDYYLDVVAVDTSGDQMPGNPGMNGIEFFDMEHAHMMSLPFFYYISGNEHIREGVIDYGEFLMRTQRDPVWFNIPTIDFFRAWSRKLRNMALCYEFTVYDNGANATYKSEIDNSVNAFLDYRDSPPSIDIRGRNLNRGYVYWDSTLSGNGRVIHSFFHTQIHFEAMWQLLRIMKDTGWNFARQDDLEDYMLGLSQFFYKEYVDPYPTNGDGFVYGFNYDYLLDSYQAPTLLTLAPYSASRAAIYGYERTGDASYLDKAGIMLWSYTVAATSRNPTDLPEQALIYYSINRASIPTWDNLSLSVQNNGGGSYTLKWTVPSSGATKFQIKYSDKPIVDWLGFNKATRTYQYDPSQYTAYFAAKNVSSEPVPATPGTIQSTTITGLDPSKQWYFAAKRK